MADKKEIENVILDLMWLLRVYVNRKDNHETRGQARATLRDAADLLAAMSEDERELL